jgi:hypothetical protein
MNICLELDELVLTEAIHAVRMRLGFLRFIDKVSDSNGAQAIVKLENFLTKCGVSHYGESRTKNLPS